MVADPLDFSQASCDLAALRCEGNWEFCAQRRFVSKSPHVFYSHWWQGPRATSLTLCQNG